MHCRFDPDLLQQYVDGEIGKLERVFAEEHLKVCPKCQALVKELVELAATLERLGNIESGTVAQLDALVGMTLDSLPLNSKKLSLRERLNRQRRIMNSAMQFVRYMPGSKVVAEAGKKSVQYAPKILWGLSRSLVVGGARLAKVWA